MSEEDEISLIMESDDSSALELRILREEWGEKPSYFDTDFGVEVIENEFGDMFCGYGMMFDVLLELDIGDFKYAQHSFQMSDYELIPMVVVPDNHNMGIVESFSVVIEFLEFHIGSGVIVDVMEHHHQLTEVVVDFLRRTDWSGEQDLDGCLLIQVLLELVQFRLIVLVQIFLTSLLLVLDRYRLLTLRCW